MSKPSRTQALEALHDWHGGLRTYRQYGGLPAKGTIAAVLVVSERLKSNFDLRPESHRTAGGGQIAGVSGSAVQKILGHHGETRRFLSEGGRSIFQSKNDPEMR